MSDPTLQEAVELAKEHGWQLNLAGKNVAEGRPLLPDLAAKNAAEGFETFQRVLELARGEVGDVVTRAADAIYYDTAECPLCLPEHPDCAELTTDEICQPDMPAYLGEWWSQTEIENAHFLAGFGMGADLVQPGPTGDYRTDWCESYCGQRFIPRLSAYGIQLTCETVQTMGACVLCLDRLLIRHKPHHDCTTRACRVQELFWERERGIFR